MKMFGSMRRCSKLNSARAVSRRRSAPITPPLLIDRISEQPIPIRDQEKSCHLVRNKTIVKVAQSDGAFHRPVLNIDSRQSVPTARFQIRVEVHPVTVQRRQTFAVPEKFR